jgi:hypothetical protein
MKSHYKDYPNIVSFLKARFPSFSERSSKKLTSYSYPGRCGTLKETKAYRDITIYGKER